MLDSLLLFAAILSVSADPTAKDDESQRWLDFYTAEAAQYKVFLADQVDSPLHLETPPIFNYTNPVRTGEQHGAVFVWTKDGQPEVVGSIWSSHPAGTEDQHRSISHEFQSLSTSGIQSRHAPRIGRKGPVPDWETTQPGVEWKLIEGTAEPAQTAALRLIQMKRLAAEFTAGIIASNVEGQDSLRLMTQPLFRFASDSDGILDGGLFAFVQATDPELLLLIEARSTPDGPRWHYAAAPFTNRPLRLKRHDQAVWNCPKAEAYVSGHPYFLYWGVSARDGLPGPEKP